MIHKQKIFTEKEVKGADFVKDTFINCKFVNMNLRFATFDKCKFNICDFSGSTFDITSFNECEFSGSKLSNLDFSGVEIKKCNLSGAIIENSVFQMFKDAGKNIRKKLDLKGSIFEDAYLSGSIFILCDLEGIGFRNSKLENTVFEKCNLTKADFTGADINGIRFEDTTIYNTVLDMNGFIAFGNSKGFILSK